MDRSWTNLPHISDDFERRVEEFTQFSQHNDGSVGNRVRIRCLCVNCLNGRRLDVAEIRDHLLCDGFVKNYTTWMGHSELLDMPSVFETREFFLLDNGLYIRGQYNPLLKQCRKYVYRCRNSIISWFN